MQVHFLIHFIKVLIAPCGQATLQPAQALFSRQAADFFYKGNLKKQILNQAEGPSKIRLENDSGAVVKIFI